MPTSVTLYSFTTIYEKNHDVGVMLGMIVYDHPNPCANDAVCRRAPSYNNPVNNLNPVNFS